MYKNRINPIISKKDFLRVVRPIVVNIKYTNALLKIREFIKESRNYFTMDKIAKLLGISRRTCYRIINDDELDLVSVRLIMHLDMLLIRIVLYDDYDRFIERSGARSA